jgi:hypothetical protein
MLYGFNVVLSNFEVREEPFHVLRRQAWEMCTPASALSAAGALCTSRVICNLSNAVPPFKQTSWSGHKPLEAALSEEQ